MNKRLTVSGLLGALAAVLIVALAGATPSPADASSAPAKAVTGVTMVAWPQEGLFGYVTSPNSRCAAGRQVRVWKRTGRGRKALIGVTRSRPVNGAYRWLVRSDRTGAGRYIVRAGPTRKCKRRQITESIAPRSADQVPNCPTLGDVCKLNRIHLDVPAGTYCPSFSVSRSNCQGFIDSGDVPWCCWQQSTIYWDGSTGGARGVDIYARGRLAELGSFFNGTVPGPGSARYSVTAAGVPVWTAGPGVRWRTPDLPGVAAGEVGGPIYFNFENGFYGADIYIHGYLYRK